MLSSGVGLELVHLVHKVSSATYTPFLRHDDEYDRSLRQVLIILCAGVDKGNCWCATAANKYLMTKIAGEDAALLVGSFNPAQLP